jgi:outer membrane lipoprotein-sorting protein
MKCPSAEQWDLLAMDVLEGGEVQQMLAHARSCLACRERVQAARREHTERLRMYEAFDRDHDELREQLMAVLPDELPSAREGRLARAGHRLGGVAMSLNRSAGRRAAAVLVPAACIVIAVAIFLAPKQSAFAAALEHMRQASTIVARFQEFINDADEPMLEGQLSLSAEHGMRFEVSMGGLPFAQAPGVLSGAAAGETSMLIFREPDGPLVMVQPSLKLVMRMHGVDQLSADPQRTSPDEFIRKFLEMTGEADRLLGRSVIDGHEVEGFEVSGEKLGLEFGGSTSQEAGTDESAGSNAAARLWVDVNSGLPVRMEVELGVAFLKMHVLAVYDQFEWDVPLEAELFVPEIPEGARTIDLTIPPMTEQTLLDGLRVYAEIAGRYPTSLDPVSVSAGLAMAWAASGKLEIDPEDPASVFSTGLVQDCMTVTVGCGFCRQLAADGHEPEYFGDIVTPEDADEVLLHWRLDDGQMRVIYGDLRVETLPAED